MTSVLVEETMDAFCLLLALVPFIAMAVVVRVLERMNP